MSQPMTYRETNVCDFPHTPRVTELHSSSSSGSSGSESVSSTTTVEIRQEMEKRLNIEALKRVDAEAIREQYAFCIGDQMPAAVFRRVLLDLIDGTPIAYYRYALDETTLAPRPSPRYMLAIVARLKREKADPETVWSIF